MRVRALGWVEAVADDGTGVELGGPLERRVLAALASRPGDVVSLDVLAGAVFGDDHVDGATIRLQNHVSRLRKRLGGRTIVTAPAGYRLDTLAVAVDWLRFEELVSRAGEVPDADEAVALRVEALSLWRGTPFSDVENWPAVQPLVISLEESRRAAEEELAAGLLASGRAGEAIARLEALVLEEPLRERRWALLLRALAAAGRTAEALRAYQQAHRALAEIGLEPGPELRELERAVAGGDAIRLADAVAPSAYRAPRRPSGALSGTVTFLFTDIEGSTRLWETAPAAMEGALARHDVILREAVDEHGGVVFSTGGDGLAAAFGRAGDAVVAAVDAQRRLQAEPWPEATLLRVRMGLHTGEAQERDGDFFGPPVNRAARIMAAAHGGQIVVSGATAGVLGPLSGVELIDLGEHRLRGVGEAIRLYAVRADGTAWSDEPLASLPELRRNLPRPLTTWFGEPADLKPLAADLPTRRLVTLTGAGGVGKTRMPSRPPGSLPTSSPTGSGSSTWRPSPTPPRWRWSSRRAWRSHHSPRSRRSRRSSTGFEGAGRSWSWTTASTFSPARPRSSPLRLSPLTR